MLWNVIIFLFFILYGVVTGRVTEAKNSLTKVKKTQLPIKQDEYYHLSNGWILSYFDINSVKGTNWLSSGIIDYAVLEIIGQGKPLIRSASNSSVVYIKADRATCLLKGRESFNKRSRDLHIAGKIILYPFCYDDNHWCLMIINTSAEVVKYYDPRDPSNQYFHSDSTAHDYIKVLKTVFKKRNNHIDKSERLNVKEWSFDSKQYVQLERVPNGHDCGLFIIRYIDQFINGKNTKINKTDVREHIRQYISSKKQKHISKN